MQADLVVRGADGRLVLMVEVKRYHQKSPSWAAQFRQNLLAHGDQPNVPYFLFAFLDHFYLWCDAEPGPSLRQPDYIINAESILQPYFDRANISKDQVAGQSLVLIVSTWLATLIYTNPEPSDLDESQSWILESGLYSAIQGGKIEHEVLVA